MSYLVCVLLRNALQHRWSGTLWCLLVAFTAHSAEPIIVTSASKQFVVRGLPQRTMLAPRGNEDLVYVDPSLLVVTCDKVRRALTRELGWGDRWRGNVYINVHPIRFDNEPIAISARQSGGKWNYYVDLPDEVNRRELFEALVAVSLVEFGDRASTGNSVELPPWLVNGMTAHLLEGPLAGSIMQARTLQEIRDNPTLVAPRTVRHADIDQLLRKTVQTHGALTFDQLNWPEFDQTNAVAATSYRHSSHLFVRELLRLRGGPDAVCAMLAMLPEHLNWQTAFMRGFEAHFRRMVDVEKWWSLTLVRVKSRDNSLTWSTAEARLQFEEILVTPMQVMATTPDAGAVVPVALQTIINDWTFEQQLPVLDRKLALLQAARMRLPAEYGMLADAYRASVEKYLRSRSSAWFEFTGRAAADRAVAELNALDKQRDQLTAKSLTARAAETAVGPVP